MGRALRSGAPLSRAEPSRTEPNGSRRVLPRSRSKRVRSNLIKIEGASHETPFGAVFFLRSLRLWLVLANNRRNQNGTSKQH